MDAFLEPFWDLEQLWAWAGWRDRDLVNFASAGRTLDEISKRASAKALKGKIGELWTASGFDRTPYRQWVKVFPRSPEQETLKIRMATLPYFERCQVRQALEALGIEEECAATDRLQEAVIALRRRRGIEEKRSAIDRIESAELRQLVETAASAPEAHGPYQLVERFPFPTGQYLVLLFRSGRLAATGNLPNEIRALKLSPDDWAGLEIGISDDTRRLGVWRIGRTANRSVILARKVLHPGSGDIENVRVQREEILKVFPANATTRSGMEKQLERHSEELVNRSLPPSSLLMMTVSPGAAPALATIGKHADSLQTWIDEVEAEPASAGHSAAEPQQRRLGKSRPALERARGAIKELYPDGVPGQATEPNANLCRRVSAKLQEESLPNVSDDTILRAAGRRK
jgi:hypothetical protein